MRCLFDILHALHFREGHATDMSGSVLIVLSISQNPKGLEDVIKGRRNKIFEGEEISGRHLCPLLHLGAVHMDPHGSIFLGWGMNEVQWKDGLGEKRTKERLTEPYQVNQ